MIKFSPVLFREWFSGWDDSEDPVVLLQKLWVLHNLAEDERKQKESEANKFDLLLKFVDHEMFKRYDDLRSGRVPNVAAETEGEIDNKPAPEAFYAEVAELPKNRISKPPIKEEYVAKRMEELGKKKSVVEVTTGEPGKAAFTYTRKILRKDG